MFTLPVVTITLSCVSVHCHLFQDYHPCVCLPPVDSRFPYTWLLHDCNMTLHFQAFRYQLVQFMSISCFSWHNILCFTLSVGRIVAPLHCLLEQCLCTYLHIASCYSICASTLSLAQYLRLYTIFVYLHCQLLHLCVWCPVSWCHLGAWGDRWTVRWQTDRTTWSRPQ